MFTEILRAALYGLIEGLTEFIPVSSTGHLILLANWLGEESERTHSFLIFIQFGAILAALLYYRARFKELLNFKSDGKEPSFSGLPGIFKIIIACIPASLIGFFIHDLIKANLFTPQSVATALFVGGVLMLLLAKRKGAAELEVITYQQAFVIGCFQVLSLWPGFSRSGSTIIGGILCGLKQKAAADFSFMLAVPIIGMASCYDLLKSLNILSVSDLPFFLAGFIFSFIFGYLSIAIFLKVLGRFSLAPFGWYRIALAMVIFLVLSK